MPDALVWVSETHSNIFFGRVPRSSCERRNGLSLQGIKDQLRHAASSNQRNALCSQSLVRSECLREHFIMAAGGKEAGTVRPGRNRSTVCWALGEKPSCSSLRANLFSIRYHAAQTLWCVIIDWAKQNELFDLANSNEWLAIKSVGLRRQVLSLVLARDGFDSSLCRRWLDRQGVPGSPLAVSKDKGREC